MSKHLDLSVYLVTDRALSGERSVLEVVRQALAGGVSIVQLRDPTATTADLLAQARELAALARQADVPFIVNDRVDVALAARADGVHLGQSDMPAADARALLGPDRIIGLSVSSVAELSSADLASVDYLGIGPVFSTRTKLDAGAPLGIDGLRALVERAELPVVAIGGIDADNAAHVLGTGVDGVAVVSAICAARDPRRATAALAAIAAVAHRESVTRRVR
jgi:thiamine-phosphate pyrophosphorylase